MVSLRESGQHLKAGLHGVGSQAPLAFQFRLARLSVSSWCWGCCGGTRAQAEKSPSHGTESPSRVHISSCSPDGPQRLGVRDGLEDKEGAPTAPFSYFS